jgi:hypothetical protein
MTAAKTSNATNSMATAAQATLRSLRRGIVGYISYLAACRCREVYSEYLLYEPILRVGMAQGYTVSAEVPVDRDELIALLGRESHRETQVGDLPKIDFAFERGGERPAHFGLEVKWVRQHTVNVTKDIAKLHVFGREHNALGYLLVFGHAGVVDELELRGARALNRQKHVLSWRTAGTAYAARWYRVA